MADSTGIVIATGSLVAANEAIFAPMAGQKMQFNWRIIPATGLLAIGLAALERLSRGFAVGLAWLGFGAALIVRFGNAPTPLENINKVMKL